VCTSTSHPSLTTTTAPRSHVSALSIDIGQGDVRWIVLTDPEGNEFCVLTPR
jgi:hypothetical protein